MPVAFGRPGRGLPLGRGDGVHIGIHPRAAGNLGANQQRLASLEAGQLAQGAGQLIRHGKGGLHGSGFVFHRGDLQGVFAALPGNVGAEGQSGIVGEKLLVTLEKGIAIPAGCLVGHGEVQHAFGSQAIGAEGQLHLRQGGAGQKQEQQKQAETRSHHRRPSIWFTW